MRAERPIEVADKRDAAGGREDAGEIWRALLVAPFFLQRPHVVRGELSDLAVGTRRLEEPPVAGGSARSLLEVDLPGAHLHACLAQRQNDNACFGVVAHRLPVLAA